MFAVVAKIKVKPEHKQACLDALRVDGSESLAKEPGCLQFTLVEDNDDPNLLHLFELYTDAQAFEAHMESPHFAECGQCLEGKLAGPLELTTGTVAFPQQD